MAGDSETLLKDHGENTNGVRQPFLIGVSGGTASGKVGTLSCLDLFHCFFYQTLLSLALLPDANASWTAWL